MLQTRSAVAVVARHQCDERHIIAIKPEDFGIQDQILRMLVMGLGAHVGADLMENGGYLQQQEIVIAELMELLEFFEKQLAKVSYVVAVTWIRLVALGENFGGTENFVRELAGDFLGDEQVGQQASFVAAGGDVESLQLEGLGDGQVDFQGR